MYRSDPDSNLEEGGLSMNDEHGEMTGYLKSKVIFANPQRNNRHSAFSANGGLISVSACAMFFRAVI